ncbi:Ejaculatory bulb-specific protein 3 [Papilio xuthus]|uniref:Ejaculatory bulb-specific protein 3 n=1 Tax=Papilio xuthus TaxID=66420 RepID=A0A194QK51_PAPXU|nr:Ejaculatory bulb-specific protein 3 [Papilio xuthus]
MNSLLLFSLLTLFVVSFANEQYTDRYDNINIDEILSNKRLLTSYIKCILDKGRCTPEGKELKLHIKDGMQNSCSKCTDFQKNGARKVVKYIRANEKESWEEMKKKYDPKDEYKEKYEAFLAAEN